jgi:hypothetical protein
MLRKLLIDVSHGCAPKDIEDVPKGAKKNFRKNKTSFIEHMLLYLFPAHSANIEVISSPEGKSFEVSQFVSLRSVHLQDSNQFAVL